MIKKFSLIINFLFLLTKLTPNFIIRFFIMIFDNSENKIILLIRYLYIKKNAKICGSNIYIGRNVVMKNINLLELGNNISIHANCYLDAAGGIKIKDNVSIANQSSIISFEHTWLNEELPIKYNEVIFGEIVINEDVWIGCGCRILSNVKIGERSIIAAGAVVNKNVDSRSIVGGVPAKVIKEI